MIRDAITQQLNTETVNLATLEEEELTSVAPTAADAVCYAKRYPNLLQGFCKGDENACPTERLYDHYVKHGHSSHLIWGCRDRTTVHARPVAFAGLEQEMMDDDTVEAPELHVLVFETDAKNAEEMTLAAQTLAAGIKLEVFGVGATFEGFGTKWQIVPEILQRMPENALVAIVDGRDVILNIHKEDPHHGRDITEGFLQSFQALTAGKPGSVVMSTEGQCCVSALTYVKPGDYFDESGNRAGRACASGEENCKWAGDNKKLVWEDFMQDVAKDRTGLDLQDVYLNAGLVAGRPQDLLTVIETADMDVYEDDQAVFTDMMYMFPDMIVLDYAQQLFGNARWTQGMEGGGCPFDRNPNISIGSLMHKETNTMPLFLHAPGKFFECLDVLADRVGHKDFAKRRNLRELSGNGGSTCNYDGCNYGNFNNWSWLNEWLNGN